MTATLGFCDFFCSTLITAESLSHDRSCCRMADQSRGPMQQQGKVATKELTMMLEKAHDAPPLQPTKSVSLIALTLFWFTNKINAKLIKLFTQGLTKSQERELKCSSLSWQISVSKTIAPYMQECQEVVFCITC